ncbi:MAG: DUF3318 domain-containing protein [Merismopedia sp. SIO2A8]|nr:DUF3318 domain-containing protein [Symploca sp. SIO2B6]NET47939.1 DUF3318 domain-containing protein [Merismopedia sp. SIO2A8]
MLEPELELGRLQDLMPASGRMFCKLQHRPEQPTVIDAPLPFPWQRGARSIYLNLDLWNQLPEAQRDLLLLRIVSWNVAVRWFKFDLYRGLAAAGLLGTLVELSQADAIGVLVSGGLTALAATQIWRSHRSTQVELEADETAIATAQRRGYAKIDAARHLLAAIESVARIEGRPALSFEELLRCQNLKAIAGVSPVGIPHQQRKNLL